MARIRLGELLKQHGLIDDMQLNSALGEQRKWGHPLGKILIEMKVIDEETLVRALSKQLNIPAVDLEATPIPREVLKLLDGAFCLEHRCIPFHHDSKGNFLDVAMEDPTNQAVNDSVRVRTRCNVRPYIVGPFSVEALIRKHYYGETVRPHASASGDRPWMQARADERVLDLGGLASISSREMDLDLEVGDGEAGNQRDPAAPAAATPHSHPELAVELKRIADGLTKLTSQLDRDEKVLRRIMALLVEKGICSKEEIMARISRD